MTSGIGPSSSTKIEISNGVRCWGGFQGAVSSAADSWRNLGGGSRSKPPKRFWPFLHVKDK